jgi:hypothetical protein
MPVTPTTNERIKPLLNRATEQEPDQKKRDARFFRSPANRWMVFSMSWNSVAAFKHTTNQDRPRDPGQRRDGERETTHQPNGHDGAKRKEKRKIRVGREVRDPFPESGKES